MAVTFNQLIAKIARKYGYFQSGTASSGSTTALQDFSTLIEQDNFWNSHYCKIVTGTNAGLERLITGYKAASGLTFTNGFPNPIINTDTYEIRVLRDSDIKDAIDGSLMHAGTNWMSVKADESQVFSVNQQVYNMPADAISIISIDVFTAQINMGMGQWRQYTAFELFGAPASIKLQIRDWVANPNIPSYTYKMRINYLALMTVMSGATDTLGMDSAMEREAIDFLTEYALFELHRAAFSRNRTGEDARQHYTLSQSHQQAAEQIKARRVVRYPNGRVQTVQRPRMLG